MTHAVDVVRAWLESQQSEVRQIFARGTSVVTVADSGAAMVFSVAGARVAHSASFDSLEEALDNAGLSEADSVWQT